MSRFRTLLAGALTALDLGAVVTAPAAAAAAPDRAGIHAMTVNVSCESYSNRISCFAWQTGGVAPTTNQWIINGNHVPAWDNAHTVTFGCSGYTQVRAVFYDSAGGAAERFRGIRCRSGPPM